MTWLIAAAVSSDGGRSPGGGKRAGWGRRCFPLQQHLRPPGPMVQTPVTGERPLLPEPRWCRTARTPAAPHPGADHPGGRSSREPVIPAAAGRSLLARGGCQLSVPTSAWSGQGPDQPHLGGGSRAQRGEEYGIWFRTQLTACRQRACGLTSKVPVSSSETG